LNAILKGVTTKGAVESSYAEIPRAAWKDVATLRRFFDSLGKAFNLSFPNDYYKITSKQIEAHGGLNLLKAFDKSVVGAIVAAYPEHEWQIWRFERVPKGFWQNDENVMKYLQWLQKQIGVETMVWTLTVL